MINIIKDKDPIFYTNEYDVILVGTSIYCMLTNGFQNKIKNKFPIADELNDKTNYGDLRKLGKRLTIENKPIISLMYICKYPNKSRVTVDYNALENAIATANSEFNGKKVLCTIAGSSIYDGNGDKDKIMDIIKNNSDKLDLTIFDYIQKDKNKEIQEVYKKIAELKKTDRPKSDELWANKDTVLKKLFLIP